MGRAIVDFPRRAYLENTTFVEHSEAVRKRQRLTLVVSHEQRRHSELLMNTPKLDAHLLAQLQIKIAQRLIQEEKLRLADERTAERDALALSAAELPRQTIEQVLDVHKASEPTDALIDLPARDAPQFQIESDVIECGVIRVERVVLEHHRDVALLRRHIIEARAPKENVALRDLFETGHHSQGRRLAAARWPK